MLILGIIKFLKLVFLNPIVVNYLISPKHNQIVIKVKLQRFNFKREPENADHRLVLRYTSDETYLVIGTTKYEDDYATTRYRLFPLISKLGSMTSNGKNIENYSAISCSPSCLMFMFDSRTVSDLLFAVNAAFRMV